MGHGEQSSSFEAGKDLEANERCTLSLLHASALHAEHIARSLHSMLTWHVHHIAWSSFYVLITLPVRPYAWSLSPHLACSLFCIPIVWHSHHLACLLHCTIIMCNALHGHHRVHFPPCTLAAWHTRPLAHPSPLTYFSPSTFLGVIRGLATPRAPLGGKNLGSAEQQLLHCSHRVCMVRASRP